MQFKQTSFQEYTGLAESSMAILAHPHVSLDHDLFLRVGDIQQVS